MNKRAIILLTRLPAAGDVKTRLMPRLSGTACADLMWALLADLSPNLRGAEGDLFVFYTPSGPQSTVLCLRELLEPAACLRQQGENLGQRMHMAFTHVFRQGYSACLLLGSDTTLVSREDVVGAWQVLGRHDVVFGPSEDGGYWLVGLKEPFPSLFLRQNYSHNRVLEQAQAVCISYGLSTGLAATKRDIDTWDDIHYFRKSLDREKAPHLYRFLQGL